LQVSLTITDPEVHQPLWKWITMKARFESDAEARKWLSVTQLQTILVSLMGKPCAKDDGAQLYTGNLWLAVD
jgi:hypothetical protein